MVTLSKDDIRGKYDDMAALYDRMECVMEWLGIRALRRELFGRARGRVLEVAVGTGKNLPLYPAAVTEMVGIDLSPAMLDVAHRRATEVAFPVDLMEGDAEHLSFPDASFDTVASSLSTCTFTDPVAAIREMARVCRPDGRILLLEHGRSTCRVLAWLQDRRAVPHYEMLGCHLNQDPLAHVCEAGLQVIRSRRTFFGVFHLIEAAPARPLRP